MADATDSGLYNVPNGLVSERCRNRSMLNLYAHFVSETKINKLTHL